MKGHRGTSYDLSSFWRQDVEPHYSILGISVDPRSQMCSLGFIAWVIPAAVILQVPTPHNRSCSASLNRSELISPGCCSRFRHLLSEGQDYGSTYSHSYIILCRFYCKEQLRNVGLLFITRAFYICLQCDFLHTELALSNVWIVCISTCFNHDDWKSADVTQTDSPLTFWLWLRSMWQGKYR